MNNRIPISDIIIIKGRSIRWLTLFILCLCGTGRCHRKFSSQHGQSGRRARPKGGWPVGRNRAPNEIVARLRDYTIAFLWARSSYSLSLHQRVQHTHKKIRLFFSLKRAALPDIWHHPPFKKKKEKNTFFLFCIEEKGEWGLSGIQTVDFWVVLPPVGQSQSRPFERSDLRSRSSGVSWFINYWIFQVTPTSVSIMNNPHHDGIHQPLTFGSIK